MRRVFLSAFYLFTSAFLGAKPTAPDWLTKAAATPLPAYDKKTKAAYLLRETTYDVRGDGLIITTERVALRMLQPEGYQHALAATGYNTDSGKVRTALAWLIPPQGDVIPYTQKNFIEINADPDNLYNESKKIFLSASGNAVTGSTFGYELATENRSIFTQLADSIQVNLPTATLRITLILPASWQCRSTFLNHPEVTPTTTPTSNKTTTTYTWTFSDLKAIASEPAMPSTSRLSGTLGLDLIPPANWKSKEKLAPPCTNWNTVAQFSAAYSDPSCIVDATITAKANELTAQATTPLEIIKALGRHAQLVNYGLIAANISRGGGIKPHPAPLTLKRNFGDCKDKANLLRAFLRVKGIESYPIAIYSGDNQAVRPEWPSGTQFNHAILAICVPPEITGPAVLDHPVHGRLLIFDPTDPDVPVGQLPYSHYGSQVLIEKQNGDLITLPPYPNDCYVSRRTLAATLTPQGNLTATFTDHFLGARADSERQLVRQKKPADYAKLITSWVNASIRSAKITNLKNTDSFETNQHTVSFDLAASGYAQSLRGKLLIFKPLLLSRRDDTAFTEEKRTHPIIFKPSIREETVTLVLPAGHTIEELPKPVDLATPFARYVSTCTAETGVLKVTRRLEHQAAEIPAADYASVKSFYEQIIKSEQATAVLQRIAPPAPAAQL